LLSSETEHVFTDFLAYAVRELWLDKGFRANILARVGGKGASSLNGVNGDTAHQCWMKGVQEIKKRMLLLITQSICMQLIDAISIVSHTHLLAKLCGGGGMATRLLEVSLVKLISSRSEESVCPQATLYK